MLALGQVQQALAKLQQAREQCIDFLTNDEATQDEINQEVAIIRYCTTISSTRIPNYLKYRKLKIQSYEKGIISEYFWNLNARLYSFKFEIGTNSISIFT